MGPEFVTCYYPKQAARRLLGYTVTRCFGVKTRRNPTGSYRRYMRTLALGYQPVLGLHPVISCGMLNLYCVPPFDSSGSTASRAQYSHLRQDNSALTTARLRV